MKRCLILTGGPLDLGFARDFLKKESFQKVIAVDKGLEYALALGVEPDMAVGDFDTASPQAVCHFRKKEHMIWDAHLAQKDETDTELALLKARALGCGEIVVLGATGGRMDHLLGNVHLLYPCLQSGISACLLDKQNKLYLLDREHEFLKGEMWGKYISFLPLTMEVKGITLEGFRYALRDRDIELGSSLCISNELAEEKGRIDFKDGVLICVESHD